MRLSRSRQLLPLAILPRPTLLTLQPLDAEVLSASISAAVKNLSVAGTAGASLTEERMITDERFDLLIQSYQKFSVLDAVLLHPVLSLCVAFKDRDPEGRSEEHTSELQSLMRISYAVFCLKKKHINNI